MASKGIFQYLEISWLLITENLYAHSFLSLICSFNIRNGNTLGTVYPRSAWFKCYLGSQLGFLSF